MFVGEIVIFVKNYSKNAERLRFYDTLDILAAKMYLHKNTAIKTSYIGWFFCVFFFHKSLKQFQPCNVLVVSAAVCNSTTMAATAAVCRGRFLWGQRISPAPARTSSICPLTVRMDRVLSVLLPEEQTEALTEEEQPSEHFVSHTLTKLESSSEDSCSTLSDKTYMTAPRVCSALKCFFIFAPVLSPSLLSN